jgi:hypothetical protein
LRLDRVSPYQNRLRGFPLSEGERRVTVSHTRLASAGESN